MKNRFYFLKTLPTAFLGSVLMTAPLKHVHAQSPIYSHPETVYARPATMKVLLLKGEDKVLVEAKGRYQIYNLSDQSLLLTGNQRGPAPIRYTPEGLVWGKEFLPGTFQIRIFPGESKSSILINGIEYKGCVDLYAIDGSIAVINEIDVERLLRTTLSSEFQKTLPKEVLEAVAIVARTNIYAHLMHNPNVKWHIQAKDIGYQGTVISARNAQIERAIEATRFVVMTFQNSPFPATWTEDSGGKTASFSTLFRKEALVPPGVDVPEAFKEKSRFSWSFSLSKAELARIFGCQELKEFELYMDKPSGKVYGVRVGDSEAIKDLDFFTFQDVIGEEKVQSSDFTTRVEGDIIHFNGFGKGPGVGLCLVTAKKMATLRQSAKHILSNFFPHVKFEEIRDPMRIAISKESLAPSSLDASVQ